MRVRFKIGWRYFQPGQVIDEMPGGMASELQRRGIVEAVPALVESATRDASGEQTVRRFQPRRR